MKPKNEKQAKALRDADQLVRALGKKWGCDGVIIMAAFAAPVPGTTKASVIVMHVAGGTLAFKAHLKGLLREASDQFDAGDQCECDHEEVEEESTPMEPGDFPTLLGDLLKKKHTGS